LSFPPHGSEYVRGRLWGIGGLRNGFFELLIQIEDLIGANEFEDSVGWFN